MCDANRLYFLRIERVCQCFYEVNPLRSVFVVEENRYLPLTEPELHKGEMVLKRQNGRLRYKGREYRRFG